MMSSSVYVNSKGESVTDVAMPTNDNEVEIFFTEYFSGWAEAMIGIFKCHRHLGKDFGDAFRDTLTSTSQATINKTPVLATC